MVGIDRSYECDVNLTCDKEKDRHIEPRQYTICLQPVHLETMDSLPQCCKVAHESIVRILVGRMERHWEKGVLSTGVCNATPFSLLPLSHDIFRHRLPDVILFSLLYKYSPCSFSPLSSRPRGELRYDSVLYISFPFLTCSRQYIRYR